MAGSQAPVVGLTCASLPPGDEFGPPRLGQNRRYLEALIRAGATPILIPHLDDPALLRAAYRRLDAVLLPGGVDVAPEEYGQRRHEKCGAVDSERDGTELALARWCLDDGRPLLAICRGIQVLNVALGGSLYQDIAAQVPGALRHDWYPGHRRDLLAHPVRVAPGTRLAAIVGSEHASPSGDTFALEVNSLHHQAIRDLAPGLMVTAHAPDGLVEAVEVEGHPFALGVQWHPEELAPGDARAQALFDALIRAVRFLG
ncbi:MAG: gamma-glutamyl-gamma-aminobutyrate hydrolase family protein [Anaerolineae bacterium]